MTSRVTQDGRQGRSLKTIGRRVLATVRRDEDGFTLVEILFAFGLVAIAIAVGVVYLLGAQRNSNDSAARQELAKISAAETSYLTVGGGQANSAYGDCSTIEGDSSVKYQPGDAVSAVAVTASGDTWKATVKSKTGKIFQMTSDDQAPQKTAIAAMLSSGTCP